MEGLYSNIRKNKTLWWWITLGYITFSSCFAFPLIKSSAPVDYSFLLTNLIYCVIIGLFFKGLIEKQPFRVFLLTLSFTAIGMLARYILEFGEYSNAVNFTPFNIVLFLIVIPVSVTICYKLAK